jgi:uncharacterized protein (TIGR02217 family)
MLAWASAISTTCMKCWPSLKRGLGGFTASGGKTGARTDQTIGTGNDTRTKFQLMKAYTSGPTTYTRLITKPVSGTVLVEVNGALVSGANYSVDFETGIITFNTAPSNSHVVKAGFEFDVPVRFANDAMDISVEQFNAGSAPQINVIEVKTTLGVLD